LTVAAGGLTWSQANASFGEDAILTGIAASGNTVIVTGILGNFYSNDAGQTFAYSKGEIGPSQSIRPFGNSDLDFGAAGTLVA
jgi:hypothetical protein